MLLKNVAQSVLESVHAELLTGYTLGLTLTYAGGAIGRSYKNPEVDSVPFTIGAGIPSVGGATLYKLLEGPAMFYHKPHDPVGALGYVFGSMTGLLLLAATSAAKQYRNDSDLLNDLGDKINNISMFCKEKINGVKHHISKDSKIDELEHTLYSL